MPAARFAAAALLVLVGALPAHAKDAHCTAAEALVAAMTTKLPIEVDAVTETTAATATCPARQVMLARSVALKQTRMEADFKDFLQKQDNAFVCEDKAHRALAAAGWAWRFVYTFQDGDPVTITASCDG